MSTDKSEWLYRQIVEKSQDAIIFADRDGVIRLWNLGAEAIFGYQAQDAVGESLDLIVPENLCDRHWEGYRKVMATGETRYGTELLKVPALRKDGHRISIEFTIVLVHGSEGEVAGTAAIIRDVTVRWQREKDLKKRLTDLESKAKETKT